MYQGIATKVLTGECRLSYVHLVQPYQGKFRNNTGKAKYQVTLLIPKTDTATKADIDASIQAAYEQGVTSKWQGARPQMKNALIYDGDGVKTDGTAFGAECKGHWVITASSESKPQVVHISNIKTEIAPQDIYSGMYGRVTLNFYSYNNESKGVGCGLGNVMKTRDGEPLSGGASAASDFAGLEQIVAPQATTPQGAATQQQSLLPGYNPAAAVAYKSAYPQAGTGFAAPMVDPITGMPINSIMQ